MADHADSPMQVYGIGKDLCVNSFMHIINLCTGSGPTVGGSWFTDNMKYEIHVLQVGGSSLLEMKMLWSASLFFL
jgi:hypothetical protein